MLENDDVQFCKSSAYRLVLNSHIMQYNTLYGVQSFSITHLSSLQLKIKVLIVSLELFNRQLSRPRHNSMEPETTQSN